MAYAAAPQAFTFAGQSYVGAIESFTGRTPRRLAVHEFLKRPGARVEDMANGPRRLEVRLEFIGDDCATQYADFLAFIAKNPSGLLVHPSSGKWNAYCEGPSEEVSLTRAINEIAVRVSFVEDSVAAPAPQDVPSAPTAAQNVTSQQAATKTAIATYMGAIAQGYLKLASAQAAVQDALANVALATDPIALVRAAVSTAVGVTSAAIGAIASVATQGEILDQAVTNFVLSTSDIYTGLPSAPISSDEINSNLGAVVAQAQATEAALFAASLTPAGAAEAVGNVEELVASCYVLVSAIAAETPPVVDHTVKQTIALIPLMVLLFPDDDATQQALVVMSLNRIRNPAAILAGTVLRVPSR